MTFVTAEKKQQDDEAKVLEVLMAIINHLHPLSCEARERIIRAAFIMLDQSLPE